MAQDSIVSNQHQPLAALFDTMRTRADAAAALGDARRSALETAQRERDEQVVARRRRHEHDLSEHERVRTERKAAFDHACADRVRKLDTETDIGLSSLRERVAELRSKAEKRIQEAKWLADTVREAAHDKASKQVDADVQRIGALRAQLSEVHAWSARIAKRLAADPIKLEPGIAHRAPSLPETLKSESYTGEENGTAPVDITSLGRIEHDLGELLQHASGLARGLDRSLLARLFTGIAPWVVGATLVMLGMLAGLLAGQLQVGQELFIGAGAGLAGGLLVAVVGRVVTGRRVRTRMALLHETLQRGADAGAAADMTVERVTDVLIDRDRQRAASDLEATRQRQRERLDEADKLDAHRLPEFKKAQEQKLTAIRTAAQNEWTGIESLLNAERDALLRTFERDLAQLDSTLAETTAHAERVYAEGMADLRTRWVEVATAADAAFTNSERWSGQHARSWDDAVWNGWFPGDQPQASADASGVAIPFGRVLCAPEAMPGGLPKDDDGSRVPGLERQRALASAIDLAHMTGLTIKTPPSQRERAMGVLRSVMLRLLTTLPPGKVRFTILDPVGLGQSFAGFMHLGDHDPLLVSDRIWTESRHIDQKLLDLTEHMETVIQKYLRNEFETIAQYNAKAGEIAEPYRVLVAADFPSGFTETAARRLASIAQSGPRCGVHALVSVDTRQSYPPGFDVQDLLSRTEVVEIDDAGVARWTRDPYATLPLELDEPPSDAVLTPILSVVGEQAVRAGRVEVPFEMIAPAPGKEWTRTCDDELRVPLGRTGATKLQELSFGRGTAQHGLVAGKTGSGKSTLLHILITNLALWYSPDEVEFYLVDFKKGVEFKAYCNGKVPHARAVAIESDREFGLSVIAEVDQELRRRGELFRDLSVQNLAGYRAKQRTMPERYPPMPRTLVIIDEFQELFTEDDKVSQDASLLLDRLVRQGRAFGIHVLMGSQTLSGAYSVARTTLGQMAVRVALQCSESDSYVILHEDNSAARLLTRPGEAIYNDGGGLAEHNSPFQICWLSDDQRDAQHDRIAAHTAQFDTTHHNGAVRPKPVVFEGGSPARLGDNPGIAEALSQRDADTDVPRAATGYVGEPVSIKAHTGATFRRQSGSNLLVVGQRDQQALGILGCTMLSLAARHRPEHARFLILDATPADDPSASLLSDLCQALPHECTVERLRGAATVMNRVACELDRREVLDALGSEPSVYVLVAGLHRFRDLRRSEDDYSFSMDALGDDEAPAAAKPDKTFARLIREGPVLGMHAIAWCDTVANVERAMDRQTTREFDHRVLFQMNATDSSVLIDSPVASTLGLHRALFASEETGEVEKFRPYELPAMADARLVVGTNPEADQARNRTHTELS